MKDIPTSDILPKIIGNVERHEVEVIQTFLPKVLLPIEDPSP